MPTDNDWLRRIHDLLGTGSGPGGITQSQVQQAIELAANLQNLQGLTQAQVQQAIEDAVNLQNLYDQLVSIQNEINSGTVNQQVQGGDEVGQPLTRNPVPISGVDSLGRVRRVRTTPDGFLQIQPTRPKFTNTYQFTGASFNQSVGALSGVVVQFVSGAAGAVLDVLIPSPQALPTARLSVGERWELMHTMPAGNLAGVVSNASPAPLIYVTTFELWE